MEKPLEPDRQRPSARPGGRTRPARAVRPAALALLVALLPLATLGQPAGPPSGDQLLVRATEQIEQLASLAARVRCEGTLFDLPVRGEGTYQQLNHTGRILVRLDLKLTTGTVEMHMEQVGDGRFLWESTESPGSRSVGRIDLRELQRQPADNRLRALRKGSGGLPALMQSLIDGFHFGSPRPGQLDELQVFRLEGRTTDSRAQVHTEESEFWRSHLPDRVIVLLGIQDLIPYRIQFRRGDEVLLSCELFEVVVGGELDPRQFRWEGEDRAVEDRTKQLLGS